MAQSLIRNKNGSAILWLICVVIIFSSLMILAFDMGNIYLQSHMVKLSVDKAIKAASLPVQDNEFSPYGVFLIDPVRSEQNFNNILRQNLRLNGDFTYHSGSVIKSDLEITRFEFILNDPPNSTSQADIDAWKNKNTITYTNPTFTNLNHIVEHPSVVASVRFTVDGAFISRTFTINRISAAQLMSAYD